jgi:hypothetical protein
VERAGCITQWDWWAPECCVRRLTEAVVLLLFLCFEGGPHHTRMQAAALGCWKPPLGPGCALQAGDQQATARAGAAI